MVTAVQPDVDLEPAVAARMYLLEIVWAADAPIPALGTDAWLAADARTRAASVAEAAFNWLDDLSVTSIEKRLRASAIEARARETSYLKKAVSLACRKMLDGDLASHAELERRREAGLAAGGNHPGGPVAWEPGSSVSTVSINWNVGWPTTPDRSHPSGRRSLTAAELSSGHAW